MTKAQRRRENRALDAIIAMALHPALAEEHDLVRVRADIESEGHKLTAGMVGTVVGIYQDAYAVEFPALGPAVVVTIATEAVERASEGAGFNAGAGKAR